jgi:hypothetical protein
MDPLFSVSKVQKMIQDLEEKEKTARSKLERAEAQKKEGARFYQGTELPIDDVIFSIREGQVKSAQIALEYYRQTLEEIRPMEAPRPGSQGLTVS